jgi:hypothetical protein
MHRNSYSSPHITKTAPHQGLCWVHRSHALIGLQPSDMRALSPLRPLTTEVAPQHSKHVPVVGQQLSRPLPVHCSEPSHAQHHNPTPWYRPRVIAQVREQAHWPILGGLRQPQRSAQHVLYAEGQGRPPQIVCTALGASSTRGTTAGGPSKRRNTYHPCDADNTLSTQPLAQKYRGTMKQSACLGGMCGHCENPVPQTHNHHLSP